MVTEEKKERSEVEESDNGPSDVPATDTEEPSTEEESDDEGWPKSWILVTAILGIIAIIIVARLLGQSWRAEGIQPPPPLPPQPAPTPQADEAPKKRPSGHKVGPHRLVLNLTDVTVPTGGKHCLGTDNTAHPVKKRGDVVDPCRLSVEGAGNYRLEVVRHQSRVGIPIWIFPLLKERALLAHTVLPPPAEAKGPMWIAGRFYQPYKTVVVVMENSSGEPIKLKRVRLMARGE